MIKAKRIHYILSCTDRMKTPMALIEKNSSLTKLVKQAARTELTHKDILLEYKKKKIIELSFNTDAGLKPSDKG